MDNAIEACDEVIASGHSASISLKLLEQKNAIIFKQVNSSLPIVLESGVIPSSTKRGAANHGFGL